MGARAAGQVFGGGGKRADGMRSGERSGSRADDGWPVAGEAQMVEHHGAQMLIMMTLDIGRCLLYTIVVSEYKYHLKCNVGVLWTLMRVLKMP